MIKRLHSYWWSKDIKPTLGRDATVNDIDFKSKRTFKSSRNVPDASDATVKPDAV